MNALFNSHGSKGIRHLSKFQSAIVVDDWSCENQYSIFFGHFFTLSETLTRIKSNQQATQAREKSTALQFDFCFCFAEQQAASFWEAREGPKSITWPWQSRTRPSLWRWLLQGATEMAVAMIAGPLPVTRWQIRTGPLGPRHRVRHWYKLKSRR